ncbi:MAG: transporter substrate-binding domain-containing protein [Desulfamplus sp.]|nr:transporter substrate-binding domain-containing protein [Desulfamplus sp.]
MLKKMLVVIMVSIMSLPVFVLGSEKKIVISGCEWEPYTGKSLLNKGFFTEIAVKALEKAGYQVDVEIVPWKRALETSKSGDSDGLLGASFTEERTQFFHYPKYYWKNAVHFFVKKGKKITFTTLEALCPASVGILAGSFYEEKFRQIECIKLDPAPAVNLNIRKLIAGRFDYIIESKDSVNYIMKKEFSNDIDAIEPMLPAYEIDRIFLVFSKKNPNYQQISDDFDKGITMIQESGLYVEILKNHGIH